MGVLTHLDFFKENKQLRKTKKQLKKRFMYETGQDYKLFYLSGIKYETYPQMEVCYEKLIKILIFFLS